MRLPRGTLLRSRVVGDPATPLADAFERSLNGYGVFVPQQTLLLDDTARGVITFENGVPVVAYHTGTERGGPDAIADLAVPGPYRIELYRLPDDALAPIHESAELRVPPDLPARRLGGDDDLAARIRASVPDDVPVTSTSGGDDPLSSFLDDDQAIADLRACARAEARDRAERWGLTAQLVDGPPNTACDSTEPDR